MRIAHVVTYLSATGAYGGPVSVAAGHCRELAARGHDVVLYAGWDGLGDGAVEGGETRSRRARRLLPSDSFSLLFSLPLLLTFVRQVRRFDVVHVHLARDLVTLPLALVCLLARTPLVVQTHGMIVPDRRLLCRVLDALAVRRVLRTARRQLVLTDLEHRQVLEVAPDRHNVVLLENGVRPGPSRAHWPHDDEVPEVVFCSRLHPRKRAPAFVEMAEHLVRRGVRARFSIVGPDEGDLSRVTELIADRGLAHAVPYEGSLPSSKILTRLAESQVFVLPSVDEPFPMTVLEAMSVGLPVVITESNGLAGALRSVEGCRVTTPSYEALAEAVEGLIFDEESWRRAADSSAELVRRRFELAAVVDRLEETYRNESD